MKHKIFRICETCPYGIMYKVVASTDSPQEIFQMWDCLGEITKKSFYKYDLEVCIDFEEGKYYKIRRLR